MWLIQETKTDLFKCETEEEELAASKVAKKIEVTTTISRRSFLTGLMNRISTCQ